jgi:DNA replication and repair protein RecF
LRLLNLTTTNFRNLAPATLTWSAEVNLIVGDNGAGKTNLLEAISVLTTLYSFRTRRMHGLVRHGEREFFVAGEIAGREGRRRLEQTVSIGPPLTRELSVDGRRATTAEFLEICPIFAITGAHQLLVTGPPIQRRRFLDRYAFLLEPVTLQEVRRYQRALRQRNAALARRAADDELAAWEARLSMAAAAVTLRRDAAAERLAPAFASSYAACRGEGFPDVSLRYVSAPWLNLQNSREIVEESYRKRYNETRARDRRVGSTVEGPHRHDVRLDTDGRPVRDVLSSGQTKVVATALLLAAVGTVEQSRGEPLPVVIDDVDAELDREVFARLSDELFGERQMFLSSARPEAVAPLVASSYTLRMSHGQSCGHTAGTGG